MILRPKKWHDFQHYKNRNPPWIKLHKSLLDDFEFQSLPIASRALAPMLWLLASESPEGEIHGDSSRIAFRLRMTTEQLVEALKPLIHHGFFEDASGLLASCNSDAMPETETETETENRTPPTPSPRGKPKKPKREVRLEVFSDPSHREAFDALWAGWPKRADGQPSKGSPGKAEECFKTIVEGGETSAAELVVAAELYAAEYPKAIEGYVQNISTFLSLKNGLWRQFVKIARARAQQMELADA